MNEDFSRDEMPIYGTKMPQAVVFPANTQEVSAIMKLCYDNDIPVTVRGAGTGLVGGCTPLAGGVVLCTMNMNQILEYDLNNLNVRIQPGVRLCDLAADALKHGMMYPPDPGEKTGSVGGNVSTNAGGMRAVKYGTTRDYVMAMTVVLPNGEIMEVGRAVNKTSSGYSLLHLIIGSEGTLAVITELTMKLIPNPPENTSFILPFEDIDAAISAVPQHQAGRPGAAVHRVHGARHRRRIGSAHREQHFPDERRRRRGWRLHPGHARRQRPRRDFPTRREALEVSMEHGAYDALVVDQPAEKEAVWAARSAFLTVIENDSEMLDEMDVVVPTDKIAEFLHYIYGVGAELGVRIRSFGHAGDGNLHIYCAGNDMPVDEFLAKSTKVMEAAYAKCAELGGQVSGEHGIGHAKKEYLRESVGDTAMGLMAGIKQVFDPKGLLNPGKICTDL